MAFTEALSRGKLSAQLGEQIAVAVAEANGCEYCLSAHTAIGGMVGVETIELAASRHASSNHPKVDAALKFAQAVNSRRGGVTEAEIERLRDAGYGDGEIAEIIAHVALNVFTNYFNIAAQTEIDFPKVQPGTPRAA